MWWKSCVFASLCTLLLWQIKGNLESTHLKLGTTGTTISSPIMLSSEHKSGVFNSYWRMHPMGRKTKPWTHPNNSQKGFFFIWNDQENWILSFPRHWPINHKTPDCTISKTEQVQFFAGSWSTWPLLSQNYIKSYSPLPARYKCHWQQEDVDCWYT